jgi:murein DD-endopeptidase MepM/ murein hydrolase activator NlpD
LILTRRKITFLIVPENTSNVKQVKCSKGFLVLMVCVALALVVGTGVLIHDYVKLKGKVPAMEALAREVTNQRVQIQAYAKRIGSLNKRMGALHDFEKKIRIMANVEAPEHQDGVFGIGGTTGQELEDLPQLTESHNRVMRTMHAQLEQLDEASFVQQKAFEQLYDHIQHQKSLLACTPAIKPTKGWVSSKFGYRKSPFTGLREFHSGLDLATRRGTPVIASADGVVTFCGRNGGLGKMVKINHGYGKVSRYAHLHEILVKRGDRVKRGDKIGLVGNTGRSTAPHLHYEVHVNGIPVNPEKYILN